jgi:predicted enzyme related to lactoylglutathione lyase
VLRVTRILRTRHVLAVQDLKASKRYYVEVLGFEVDIEPEGWVFLKRDAGSLMLGECPDSPAASTLGNHSYFAYFEVQGIDAFHDAVVAAGGETLSEPRDQPWGMREFGVCTVDGHRILFGESTE